MKTTRLIFFSWLLAFVPLIAHAGQFSVDTISAIHLNTTPTADGFISNAQNTTKSAYNIYSPIVPAGWYFYDTKRSILDLESGATVQQGSAFGAYTYNATAQGLSGNQANAVGLYVGGVNAVDNSATWGLNTSCDDNTVNGAATLTGRKCTGYEADFTANGASTIEGVSLILQGPGTVANANGVQVSRVSGSTAQWTWGFITNDGAAANGMQLGAAAASGSNIASQPLFLAYYNGSGVHHAIKFQAINDALNITSDAQNDGIYIATNTGNPIIGTTGSDADINMNLYASGTGEIIAHSPVQLPGYTVATLPSGQKGAEAYVTDATSCTFLGSVTGGGSTFCPVIFDGTAWVGH